MNLPYLFKKSAILLCVAGSLSSVQAEDLKPEDIVTRHLESIGPAQVRATVKSRVVQGKLKFHSLVGGSPDMTGTWGRVSQQRESNFVMRFAAGGDWRGEQFVFDGNRIGFATATSSHTRSVFAQFVSSQDFIIKEGLLGGELSTGWALQHLDQTHAKLQLIGRRKIDGREAIGLQYYSKTSKDMQVKLYFDRETYHHVMTLYTVEMAPNMSSDITASSSQHENRYTMEEQFSDFQAVDGVTLPTHYRLQYTQEVQSSATDSLASPAGPTTTHAELLGSTRVYDWDMTADEIRDNVSLDPGNFRVK